MNQPSGDTAILERITDAFVALDINWCFTYINNKAGQVFNRPAGDLINKPIWEEFPEMVGQLFYTACYQAMHEQQTISVEEYYPRTETWFEKYIYPSPDGLTVLFRDITDRKTAEEKIAEEKYRTLVEQASDAIYITDMTGRLLTVNVSGCRLTGYSEKELLQMSIFDFVDLVEIQKNPFRFDELKEGKTVVIERRLKGKGGLVLNVECIAKMLSDGRILVFARDISDRIRAQQEIIKEKNISDSLINSLPGVFYLYNKEGRFLRWNTNFETVSGYSSAEISKMHPLDFFDDDEKGLLAEKIFYTFIYGDEKVLANFVLKSKEKIPYYFTGRAIDYDGEPCLMGVGLDFSERVKAQEEIRQTTEKLRQLTVHLQKIREEERKRIGREIHDELGQQITAIKMDVVWIDKKTPEQAVAIKEKLKNIITLLDGGNQSVRRILSELRPIVLDNQGLPEALEVRTRQFMAATGISVVLAIPETEIKLPDKIADCIFRVYQESLTNIMRYADAHRVLCSLQLHDKKIVLTIEDDGKGFDTAVLQSNQSFGIAGMKERVFSLGGEFELRSEAGGKGTTTTVSIPCPD